jgi:hypothetical protein
MRSQKSINIIIPNGDPGGIFKISLKTVRALRIPRPKLSSSKKQDDIEKSGVYFLIGEDPDDPDNQKVYIGEGRNCYKRLINHRREKDFWEEAVSFTSNRLSQWDVAYHKFVEHKCIDGTINNNRFNIEQSNTNKPNLYEGKLIDAKDDFKYIKVILSVLGHNVFEPIRSEEDSIHVHINYKKLDSEGEYKNSGEVTVFEGSEVDKELVDSIPNRHLSERKKLIENGTINDDYVFTKDCAFSNPTIAAGVITGSKVSGRRQWVNADGDTLNDLEERGEI